jgi:hypothetical protein
MGNIENIRRIYEGVKSLGLDYSKNPFYIRYSDDSREHVIICAFTGYGNYVELTFRSDCSFPELEAVVEEIRLIDLFGG